MRTLLIGEKGVMYWASLTDIRDLRAGVRKPSTVLPSLERAEAPSVSTEEWERREYLGFLCGISVNERKYKTKKVRTRRGFVSAYRYLQPLIGFQKWMAAHIDDGMYLIPMADALGYTLGLEGRDEVKESALCNVDHLGVTNYLIVY